MFELELPVMNVLGMRIAGFSVKYIKSIELGKDGLNTTMHLKINMK